MANIEILSKRQLETESKYAYCPYCYREKLSLVKDSTSLEMKDVLKKLINVKFKEIYITAKNETRVIFDTYQYCENCKRKITVEDFYKFYVAKPDGSAYYPPFHKPKEL